MKNLVFIVLGLLVACSSVTRVLQKDHISKFKKSGIIIRVPIKSIVPIEKYYIELKKTLAGYKKKNQIVLLSDINDKINKYKDDDTFYQLSPSKSFMKYKSIGMITTYVNNNQTDLKKLMTDKNLDSIIIYQVDAIYSEILMYVSFNSMVTVLDGNLQISYLDYDKKYLDESFWKDFFWLNDFKPDPGDGELLMKNTVDFVHSRLIDKLLDLGYLDKI